MGEHIAIEQGRQPWLPSSDAELVETLHRYDMPLIGVLRQGGSLHLFRCIEGHVESSNLWAYTPLTEDELNALRNTDSDALDDLIQATAHRRSIVVALANEQRGVIVSALVPDAERFKSLLHAAVDALRSATTEVDEKLARSVA